MSKLIQLFLGCYRFYIYGKCSKINTFQKGRCTQAWAAIVLLVEIATFSIFQSVKNNDSLFFAVAIVIFCTQRISTNLTQPFQSTGSHQYILSSSCCISSVHLICSIKTTIQLDFSRKLRNILKEQFHPQTPNAVWCSDITYIVFRKSRQFSEHFCSSNFQSLSVL